jgi:undecaprenyl-diphosphatase
MIDMLVGIVVAGLVGWLAMKVLLRYVSNHSYAIFAWYRLGLGLTVLIITILY